MEFGQKHYVSQMDPANKDCSSCENTVIISARGRNEGQKEIPFATLEFSSPETCLD